VFLLSHGDVGMGAELESSKVVKMLNAFD